MPIRSFLFCCAVCFQLHVNAQTFCTGTGRYADSVFTCSTSTLNIQYGVGLWDWSWTNLLCLNLHLPPYQDQLPLTLDFYEPCGDTVAKRPLVVAIHGGAWSAGDKNDLAAFCDYMAKRGYAVATINYRLSLPGNALCWDGDADSVRVIRAAFRAIQDAKAAVRFFRAHAGEYRIDPANIFAGGVSAGAFTALGVGYLNNESERLGACGLQTQYGDWLGQWNCPDMGSIEGSGGNAAYSSAVSGVLNLSGALFDLSWIDGPNDPPLISFHGTADDIVPYGYGCVLQNLIAANIYHICVKVHGSSDVQAFAQSKGLESTLVTFPGGGHGYTTSEGAIALQDITDFLCAHLKATVGTGQAPSSASPISVFPNPATDEIYVKKAPDTPTLLWQLYDFQGNMITRRILDRETSTIERQNLPAGLYAWKTDNGEHGLVIIK